MKKPLALNQMLYAKGFYVVTYIGLHEIEVREFKNGVVGNTLSLRDIGPYKLVSMQEWVQSVWASTMP